MVGLSILGLLATTVISLPSQIDGIRPYFCCSEDDFLSKIIFTDNYGAKKKSVNINFGSFCFIKETKCIPV